MLLSLRHAMMRHQGHAEWPGMAESA
jgi:hypothetical protein